MAIDYYRVLGVMPRADEVVVRAAYRALAQRYHPDRFAGDPKEANQRMAEINAAFAILGDPVKRAAYDAELRDEQASEYASSETEWQQEQAFSEAMGDLERRWGVACGVFPDLENLKQELHQISSKLSFAFVMIMLESKGFNDRKKIAEHLVRDYLRRYFGENASIQQFAKSLIMSRKKEAAKALNSLVTVMGAEVDPGLLIRRIEADYGIRSEKDGVRNEKERLRICAMLRTGNSPYAAIGLAEMFGFAVDMELGRWFKDDIFHVRKKDGTTPDVQRFYGIKAFSEWALSTFCEK